MKVNECYFISSHAGTRISCLYEITMVTHICPVCGNNFEAKRSNTVYCSEKCYSYSRRHKPKTTKPDSLTCPQCGKNFKPEKKNQKYCCHKCQRKRSDARKREVRKSTIPKATTCLICGKAFKPYRAGAKYCSKECQRESGRRRAAEHYKKFGRNHTKIPEEATCPVCGKKFKPHHARQKNCSKECTHKLTRINENIRERKKFELLRQKPDRRLYSRFCVNCGKLFITPTYAAKYCSNKCREVANDNSTKPKMTSEARKASLTKAECKVQECKFCGKTFVQPSWGTNPFCSSKCETAHYKKCSEELTRKSREAKELGLSYGEYMSYVQMGKNPADFAKKY